MDDAVITVVTGMPRCGSSMMMEMLSAGGIPPYTDNRSSYELEEIQELVGGTHTPLWWPKVRGRAIKILEPGLCVPPTGYRYDFLLLCRHPREQARSQSKFMVYCGHPKPSTLHELRVLASLAHALPSVRHLLGRYEGSQTLELRYEEILEDPRAACRTIASWTRHGPLDTEAMAEIVHDRDGACRPDMAVEESKVVARDLGGLS